MIQKTVGQSFEEEASLCAVKREATSGRHWYAVYTVPQNEKSAVKHLNLRGVESFLPMYETIRVWKNRQRMKLFLPLFPNYLFVRMESTQRARVLSSPGVLHIVTNGRECIPLPDPEIEFLRSGLSSQRIEPFRELVVGEKVRIKSGVMQGVIGTLVRKGVDLQFILTLELINQHAAVHVNAKDLEPLVA